MPQHISEFQKNIGEILMVATGIEQTLEFFIANYFVKPQIQKTFFLNDVILLQLTFQRKLDIFEKICEREGFDIKDMKSTIRSIKFIQKVRNKVAHWQAESNSPVNIQLRKRASYTTFKDILKLDNKMLQKIEEERLKAINGINRFYMKYHREGTKDERGSIDVF